MRRSAQDKSIEKDCCFDQPGLARTMEAPHIGANTKGCGTTRPLGKGDGSGRDSRCGDDNSCGSDSDDSSSNDEPRSQSPPIAAPHCHSAALALYTQRPSPVAIPPNSISLTYLHSFLSANECAKLIELAAGVFSPSRAGGRVSSDRTSHSAAPSAGDPVVQAVRRRVETLTGARDGQIETIYVVRYEPGQQYQPHFDSSGDRSYPRSHTIFVYLNDLPDGAGGETEFTRIGVKFKPKQGDALLWENRADRNSYHLDGEHAGRPPLSGVKYGEWLRCHARAVAAGCSGCLCSFGNATTMPESVATCVRPQRLHQVRFLRKVSPQPQPRESDLLRLGSCGLGSRGLRNVDHSCISALHMSHCIGSRTSYTLTLVFLLAFGDKAANASLKINRDRL